MFEQLHLVDITQQLFIFEVRRFARLHEYASSSTLQALCHSLGLHQSVFLISVLTVFIAVYDVKSFHQLIVRIV